MAAANATVGLGDSSERPLTGNGSARLGNGFVRPKRAGTLLSVQTQVSRVTSRAASIPFIILRKLTNQTSPELESSLSELDSRAKDEFFRVTLGRDSTPLPISETELLIAPCIAWYSKFLECRFEGSWTTLVRPALLGLCDLYNQPRGDETAVIYHFLSILARLLLDRDGLAMVEIVDEMANLHLLKETDDERAIANQLAFAAVGWLTMLFDPDPRQDPGALIIRRSTGSISRQRRLVRDSRTFTSYRQQDFDGFDQPLFIFLRRFGHLIPEIDPDLSTETENITVSYVCFSMLDKVADVKIEWVNSLSLHLEFDNVRRVLKVFRFPSYCLLMCREATLLSHLYLDHSQRLREHRVEEPSEDLTLEYFREALLSYRLIFGQDKDSWRSFNRKIPTWGDKWDCSDQQSDDSDPLLRTLCGAAYNSPNAGRIYREIDALDDTSPYYFPDSDFPFFGRRILNLQAFVRGRNPHDWRALWHDRRNVAFWWTFWAVLFIGGCTILLAFLQTAFQLWSSISGQKQLAGSNPAPPQPT